MIQFRRRNTAWLIALGALVAFVLAAASIPTGVQAILMGLFMAVVVASLIRIDTRRNNLVQSIRRAPMRSRVSPQAKEAVERVRGRGGYMPAGLALLDFGLIALQSGQDGITMRRTRSVSKDDNGVRPFITIHVDPDEAERFAMLRFEIVDQSGHQIYVHEMKSYLRDGEMNIMADHHLPLASNATIQGSGDWDLRLFIDGSLVAMHNFMLTPSIRERQRRLSGDWEAPPEVLVEEIQQELTLKDLIKTPQKDGAGQRSTNRSSARRS